MKILILSASPQRDKVVDELIADELKALGNEVWIKPCLREGRPGVLELQPDVVVTPPIRNPYSRDFVETLKGWGIGVVSRHTEASCDWQDYKAMPDNHKADIVGRWTYAIDKELVWGEDEKEILTRRGCPFPVVAVGSFSCDIYQDKERLVGYGNKEAFTLKRKLDNSKKTILISAAWGFADSAPDLRINEIDFCKRDEEGRKKHLEMISAVFGKLKDKYNILVTTHPGIGIEPYQQLCKTLGIYLDTESTATELLVNTDYLIHSGSTMAIESHFLNHPTFQFGDVNLKTENWFLKPDSAISKVSPRFDDPEKMAEAIESAKGSNANEESLKALETGRYGKMDGQATKRAAKEINEVKGKFQYCWPLAHRDYDQPLMFKDVHSVVVKQFCGVCKNAFYFAKDQWIEKLVGKKVAYNSMCPHCGSKFFRAGE